MTEQPSGMAWPVLTPVAPAAGAAAGGWHVQPLGAVVAHDSRDLLPIVVTHAGKPVTAGLRVSVTRHPDARDWRSLDSLGATVGIRPGGRLPGGYHVTVRTPTGDELDAGRIIVT